jgi:hypothetical protein
MNKVRNTQLGQLTDVFDELGIGYTKEIKNFPYEHMEIFLQYSNISYLFSMEGNYMGYEISN